MSEMDTATQYSNPPVALPLQELVFLGEGLDTGALQAALEGCLLREGEVLMDGDDPFLAWPAVEELMDAGEAFWAGPLERAPWGCGAPVRQGPWGMGRL